MFEPSHVGLGPKRGFWLDLSPRHIGSSPKQSFGWVRVPDNGFKSQSEVYGFGWDWNQFPNFTSFLTVWLISHDFLSFSLISICKSCTIPLWKHRADSGCNNNNNKEFVRKNNQYQWEAERQAKSWGKLKEARRKSGPLRTSSHDLGHNSHYDSYDFGHIFSSKLSGNSILFHLIPNPSIHKLWSYSFSVTINTFLSPVT